MKRKQAMVTVQRLRFRMTVDCSGAAFADDPTNELASIFQRVIGELERDTQYDKYRSVYDTNGNVVGTFRLAIEMSEEEASCERIAACMDFDLPTWESLLVYASGASHESMLRDHADGEHDQLANLGCPACTRGPAVSR